MHDLKSLGLTLEKNMPRNIVYAHRISLSLTHSHFHPASFHRRSVELARYRIPLILVARDLSRLMAVAKDIEKHYDVSVRILQADLSSPNCARRIYDATTEAGLCVDILVNSAGLCAHGDFVDGDAIDVSRMVSVNVGAVTALSQLYGRDMRERRRGRILMVSSMSGALPGNPSVAVYAATKAYEKSLASSLGREMER
jgi:short-subunit dehydrogenase